MFPNPGDTPGNSPYRPGSAPDFVWQMQRNDMERQQRAAANQGGGGGGGGDAGGGCLGAAVLILFCLPLALVAAIAALFGGLLLFGAMRVVRTAHPPTFGEAYVAAFRGVFWYKVIEALLVIGATVWATNASPVPVLVQRIVTASTEQYSNMIAALNRLMGYQAIQIERSEAVLQQLFVHDSWWLAALAILVVPGLLAAANTLRRRLEDVSFGKALLLVVLILGPAVLFTNWLMVRLMLEVGERMNGPTAFLLHQ
ncbi:MAG: hypothetical protein JNL43_04130 [Flavobacteriales bacterium]|nr:hypothetical protein [Flavobacteriales bacterium]